MARGKLRRISEALGRATDTVDAICIAEPIRSQLNSALQDLQIATDLIFDQDAAIHCHSVNDNED